MTSQREDRLFNTANGVFRAPSTQQGYSACSTWTRGLAWAIAGYTELLEFIACCSDDEFSQAGGRESVESMMLRAARATCDHFIQHTPTCGIA